MLVIITRRKYLTDKYVFCIMYNVYAYIKMYFCWKILKTKKVIRETVSPILNYKLPLFIGKLAGLALKSQPVKSKILQIELRYVS